MLRHRKLLQGTNVHTRQGRAGLPLELRLFYQACLRCLKRLRERVCDGLTIRFRSFCDRLSIRFRSASAIGLRKRWGHNGRRVVPL